MDTVACRAAEMIHLWRRMNSATSSDHTTGRALRIGAVLFPGFEQLDLYGPLEFFGLLGERAVIHTLAERPGPVLSSRGPATVAEHPLNDAPPLDVLLVPGGQGTRSEVDNPAFLTALRAQAERASIVASVCTGAALLARTGLLDGRRATSNKRAFAWATSQGPRVNWIHQARWVEDGQFWTSSGISAGMDMALALIAHHFDQDTALTIAARAEYFWNKDASHDPFAKLNA